MALKRSFSKFDDSYTVLGQTFESIGTATAFLDTDTTVSVAKARSRLAYITPLWEKCRNLHDDLVVESSAELRDKHPYFIEGEFAIKESRYLDLLDRLLEYVHHEEESSTPVQAETTMPPLAATVSSRNKRRLLTTCLDDLFAILPANRESAEELRRLCDSSRQAVQTAANLGRPVEHWGDLLTYLTVSKLDKVTRKAWELHLGDDDEYPHFNALVRFLETRIRALESVPSTSVSVAKPSSSPSLKPANVKVYFSDTSISTCPVCGKGGHSIYKCDDFVKAPFDKRLELVRKLGMCHNCLSRGHMISLCKSEKSCRHCNKRHHSLLHRGSKPVSNSSPQATSTHPKTASAPDSTSSASTETAEPSFTMTSFSRQLSTPNVLLATAWVQVSSSSQRTARVRALLDQGSTHSFITQELSRALNASTYPVSASLHGVGDVSVGKISRVAPVSVSPRFTSEVFFATDALILPSLTSYAPTCQASGESWPHLHGLQMADPDPFSDAPIHMLIGADIYAYALRGGIRRGRKNQPVAQDTAFGWIISGSIDTPQVSRTPEVRAHLLDARPSLDEDLRRFWEIEEEFGNSLSADVEACERHFVDTHSRSSDGRYIVRIPLKGNELPTFGDSQRRADQLLLALERRLDRDPALRSEYRASMSDYLTKNYMALVDEENREGTRRVFLSHHPVVKTTSATTKVRVVFNASAPLIKGTSLNDLQFVGPKMQSDLPLLIARWRAHRFVCCADIAQMYRQIRVAESDCNLQMIRWRDSPELPIQSYRLLTVTFGTASAPFLALRVLKQLAIDEGPNFPLAAPIVQFNFYVDDCLFGASDVDSVQRIIEQLNALLSRGGFSLRKWASNDPAFLVGIDPRDHGLALGRDLVSDDTLKVLGIRWNPAGDCFTPSVNCTEQNSITKRTILSLIARLYDPLGWLSPVVITAKIFLQSLWLLKCNWDDPLPGHMTSEWIKFKDALPSLRDLSIPRWARLSPDVTRVEVHGFADASTKAYAAVVFLRVIDSAGTVNISLLVSKTKVAPVRTQSVPRLELCAALLLANTLQTIRSLPEYGASFAYCWTDSSIVLAWLSRNASSYATFVANRVSKIQALCEGIQWRHVRSTDNPADLGSRGLAPQSLATASLWWRGPPWLSLNE